MNTQSTFELDKLVSLHKWLRLLLLAGLVSTTLMLAYELLAGFGFWSLETAGEDEATAVMVVSYIAVILVILLLATIIIFGMWIYRAAANVVAAEIEGFEYSPGWSVGWHFVPVANLFKPFQAMRQIYNASLGARGILNQGHALLTIWWITWLTSNFLNNIATRLELRATSIDDLQVASLVGAAGSVVSLPLYFVALRMVENVTEGQKTHLTLSELDNRFS